MNEPTEVWVFGAFPIGHYLFTATRQRELAPAMRPIAQLLDACDGAPQVEGRLARRQASAPPMPDGWSFVSWWDRQGDKRHGSHTGILARGTWTAEQLIAAGRRLVPWAFRVDVTAGR